MPGCALSLILFEVICLFSIKLYIEKDNMIRKDRSSLAAGKDALLMLPITQSAWYRRCGALLRNHNRSSFEHK